MQLEQVNVMNVLRVRMVQAMLPLLCWDAGNAMQANTVIASVPTTAQIAEYGAILVLIGSCKQTKKRVRHVELANGVPDLEQLNAAIAILEDGAARNKLQNSKLVLHARRAPGAQHPVQLTRVHA